MTTLIKSQRLPNTLSGLLRTAVEDLNVVQADHKYKLNMRFWHRPMDGRCEVCMAGAVIARRTNANPNFKVDIDDVTSSLAKKMVAIDNMRRGQFREAYRELFGEGAPSKAESKALARAKRIVTESFVMSYDARATNWDYLRAATLLEDAGL